MRPLSLHHLSLLDVDPPTLVSAAASAGFSHCGIRLVPPDPGGAVFDLINDFSARADTNALLADSGVRVLDAEAIWLRSDTNVADLKPVLEVAADLGAKYFLTAGVDTERDRMADNLGALADVAANFDLTLSVEAITYTQIPTLREALSLVEATGRDNLVVLPDALQFFRGHQKASDLDAVPRHRLAYAQICDAPAVAPKTTDGLRHEARTARLAPGAGELPLVDFILHLPDEAPLAVEAPIEALKGKDPQMIADILARASRQVIEEVDLRRGV